MPPKRLPSDKPRFMNTLQQSILYAATTSPFYRQLLQGLRPETLNFPADLVRLPLSSKNDLFNHNRDFLCVPNTRVADWVTTSGTLGDPVWFALSDADLERLAQNEAGSFQLAGLTAADTILITTTLDRRFMAGLAYYLGARKLGASVIRSGPGIPELQWDSIQQMQPTVIIAVPSFLLKMAEYAEKNGIDVHTSPLRKAICIGEAIRDTRLQPNELALRIQEKWPGLQLFGTYASTEMSTAFTECSAGMGAHQQDALIYSEFLDEHDNPVAEGELGELVFTTIGVEAMPLVRFRSGDLVRHYRGTCACGRSSLRIGPVEGRKQQMIKYRGTTLYPPALINVLNEWENIETFQVHVSGSASGTDELHIWVALRRGGEEELNELRNRFRARIRVAPLIIEKSAEEIEKSRWPAKSRKPLLFIDHR